MEPALLAFSFLDVIWWLIIIFVWMTFITMFISVFGDIFRRDDMSGWAKTGWVVLMLFLPILGILIYLIFRPAVTPSDIRLAEQTRRLYGSAVEDVSRAHQLLESGAITQGEFEQLKRQALG